MSGPFISIGEGWASSLAAPLATTIIFVFWVAVVITVAVAAVNNIVYRQTWELLICSSKSSE